MPRNYDSIDIDFSWDGDLIVDQQGDIQDTSYNLLTSLQNEIFCILKSDLEDWRETPNYGADLGDFIGEPNIESVAKAIEERVTSALSIIIAQSDIKVRVVPVGVHRVLLTVNVEVLATTGNKLRAGDLVSVSFIYDYFERGVFVPIDEMNKFSGRNI